MTGCANNQANTAVQLTVAAISKGCRCTHSCVLTDMQCVEYSVLPAWQYLRVAHSPCFLCQVPVILWTQQSLVYSDLPTAPVLLAPRCHCTDCVEAYILLCSGIGSTLELSTAHPFLHAVIASAVDAEPCVLPCCCHGAGLPLQDRRQSEA